MANYTFKQSNDGLLRVTRKVEFYVGLTEILVGYLKATNGENVTTKLGSKAPVNAVVKGKKKKVNTRDIFTAIDDTLRLNGETYFDNYRLNHLKPDMFDDDDRYRLLDMFPSLTDEMVGFFEIDGHKEYLQSDLLETNSGIDLAAA